VNCRAGSRVENDRGGVDLKVEVSDFVATVEINRPPNNFIDPDLIGRLADHVEALDEDPRCRSVLLCSAGKNFCAGADVSSLETGDGFNPMLMYRHVVRLFSGKKPLVAAVKGAATGGGVGLALIGDFRVGSSDVRFRTNFVRLGLHPGFGTTVSLRHVVGPQVAADMLLTGRQVRAEEAFRIGLLDRVAGESSVRDAAYEVAAQLAAGAPLAVQTTRTTLRSELAALVARAVEHEARQQSWLFETGDTREGIRAALDRRDPVFRGS
jgi:2-(1,2-epoxy-1,2-dihydrophenyl)acetyl-CoA isomerase